MKVVHVCLNGPYNHGWSYQENCLSYYHRKMGLEVTIIASPYINKKSGFGYEYCSEKDFTDENGIKIIRIEPYQKGGSKLAASFKKYPDLNKQLERENPDILFIHGCQFADLITISNYLKNKKNVKTIVDNHADYSNSVSGFLSKYVAHKLINRYFVKKIEPYVSIFFGVMPSRVEFIHEMYGVPKRKINLLVMGAEDGKVEIAEKKENTEFMRLKHGIKENDFVIVTGGKIDMAKRQTILLMKAVQRSEYNVILLVFGSISDELKNEFEGLCDGVKVQYCGWLNSQESYNYFAIANLIVFPGRHSVLWEQAVGAGKPCVFRFWEGTTHVDVGGNCKFLYKDSEDEILDMIQTIISDEEGYKKMEQVAKTKGMKIFSYKQIAQDSLERIL